MIQNRFVQMTALSILGGSLLLGSTGCSDNRARAEKDALQQDNDALKAQRDAAIAAAKKAAADRDRALAAARIHAEAPAGPSALAGVAGVSEGKNASGEDQIEIEGDVLFDSAKATIKPEFKKTLDQVAEVLKTKYTERQFRIEGHTDPRPVRHSGWEDNWDLGAARAIAVMKYLVSKGVPKENVYIASFADNALKSTTDFAVDRRVDIVVVK